MKISIIYIFLSLFIGYLNECHLHSEPKSDANPDKEIATFAGGCFWCIEAPFENIDGVISVTSGYTGGQGIHPTYQSVSAGFTGHYEAVQIAYNPNIVSYAELLDLFWKQFDPTDPGGSFYDRGSQYKSAIFYHNEDQKSIAFKSRTQLNESGKFQKPIVTEILKITNFYPAEAYHQDYFAKQAKNYKTYREGSGRDQFILSIWGNSERELFQKPSEEDLRKKLSIEEYIVTQEAGTEPAFDNAYWDNKSQGIYVDRIAGEPLFSSREKYDSGTGWPSFKKPIDVRYLRKVMVKTSGNPGIEVKSQFGDSHLGHVFYDGPEPNNLRYCINSAALRFIPLEEMAENGYAEYVWLVK